MSNCLAETFSGWDRPLSVEIWFWFCKSKVLTYPVHGILPNLWSIPKCLLRFQASKLGKFSTTALNKQEIRILTGFLITKVTALLGITKMRLDESDPYHFRQEHWETTGSFCATMTLLAYQRLCNLEKAILKPSQHIETSSLGNPRMGILNLGILG